MTPELWQRLKPLYEAALELSGPARGKFVAEKCGNDGELRRELTALLRAHDEPTGPGDAPIVDLRKVFQTKSSYFSPGDLVMGRFRIVRHIGDGGMGSVYEAMDLEMGRIALKTIRADVAANPDILAHFMKEVLLARRVSGPHICRIHEWSGTDYKPVFLTMEFLEGVTLADKLRESGPFQWREAKPIALEICAGLQSIHDAGIIHRDLKCRNIMLTERNGRNCAVLMDFGLAREFTRDGAGGAAHSTRDGAIAGTPDYMAPEQFEGKELGPATDIYALGIVLYELVTGKHPYAASTPIEAAIHRARHLAPASAIQRQVPRNWDRVIDCCLEYEPARRYSSASEVARELRAGPANLGNLRKDRPWVLRLAAALALAGLAWFAFLWWQSRQYYRPGAEAHHWYDAGVAALREGSYLKATRLLTTAVNQDEQYAMAHARLAEAWADLDFDGNAQREMLIATAGERRLNPLDRQYMNAIRATLTRNFPEAVVLYGRILHELPATEKPAGYVDLGMAEERAGNPQKALEDYGRAASLDKDNAAAYMNMAILNSRLNKTADANEAFSNAESIFTAKLDQEGLANLDYERGYAANVSGNLTQATLFLQKSLEEARGIPSVQLEIRALIQLSSVASRQIPIERAIDFAQQAIRLAQESQLDAWAANGFSRLATAKMMQGSDHFPEAESAVQEALQIAQQTQQPRAEALANMVLASLRDQQNRTNEVIAPAQAALNFYQHNGYFEPAARASLLLMRSQVKEGNYEKAAQSGNNLLELAMQSRIQNLQMQAEEAVGDLSLEMERYPDALAHYLKAWNLADSPNYRAYQSLNCADALWRLGRYAESDVKLAEAKQGLTNIGMDDTLEVQIETLLSQLKYRQAAPLIEMAVTKGKELPTDKMQKFELYRSLAEVHEGKKAKALEHLAKAFPQMARSPGEEAELQIMAAEIYLAADSLKQALQLSSTAEVYFSSAGRLDSDLRSATIAAIALKLLHDEANYRNYSKKVLDIISLLKKNWGPRTLNQYLSRPDLKLLMRELPLDTRSTRSAHEATGAAA